MKIYKHNRGEDGLILFNMLYRAVKVFGCAGQLATLIPLSPHNKKVCRSMANYPDQKSTDDGLDVVLGRCTVAAHCSLEGDRSNAEKKKITIHHVYVSNKYCYCFCGWADKHHVRTSEIWIGPCPVFWEVGLFVFLREILLPGEF